MALSTAEVEYNIALASAAQVSLWLQQLLEVLKKEPTKVFEGNQSAICMQRIHSSMDEQSISIKYHFIRE